MATRRSTPPSRLAALAAAVACLAVLVALVGEADAAVHKVSLAVRVKPTGSDRVLATGKVTPAPRLSRIEIQVQRAQGWRKLAGGRLNHGAFKISFRDTGTLRLRARAFQGKRLLGISAVREIEVKGGAPGGPRADGSPSSGGATSSGGTSSGGGSTPSSPDFAALSAPSLMATIESYSSRLDHLSATANSYAAEDEFQANLAAAGLKLGEQAFEYPRFAVEAVGLSAGGAAVPGAAIAPLLYSGTTAAGGVTAPLLYGGSEAGTFTEAQAAGKIVVVSIPYAPNNSKALGIDPAIEKAAKGGAEGLVAVTQVVGDYPKWEDVNARDGTGELPVLMVGKRSGAAVIAAAEEGKAGTLTLAADTAGRSCERDVWGELEGADPGRRIFVGTPVTSFTPSATEHGSGVAITVGLAHWYASLPKAQRPETLVFMALGGHEVGWLGLQALLASPQGAWFQEADAYVHLGSGLAAPTATEEADGSIVTSPTPDPTGRLHDSENPLLVPGIVEDFAAAGVPTAETPPHEASGGEQTNAYAAGIPTASFSGASLFFHTAGDVPSRVDPTILGKDADAFRRSVDRIAAIAPGLLKAENAYAAELGGKIDAAARAPVNPTLGAKGVGGPPATPVPQC
ncbi:MAG TPA: hypothetical protein VHZ54_12330 [Solirubrobacterales bacterium]|nr:hypothetical protein [Solirubrobacterales bacterium]